MGPFRIPWGLASGLLATIYLHSICISASPSINVALKASFSPAPYLVELLETAGDENVTSYFPLLDRIADGVFAVAKTEEELYEIFIKVLRDDGHMDPPALSSYKLALSLHSAAPRIEAHYQYYDTSVEPSVKTDDTSCPVWALIHGKRFCTPDFDKQHSLVEVDTDAPLQFDRISGNSSAPVSILYADITSPTFGPFHKILVESARDGKTSYRVRHKRSDISKNSPLVISGYGVELALKRTDYIVIDDRDGEDADMKDSKPHADVNLDDEELADLKPLSTSELLSLSAKASSFVMQNDDPFQTLVKLSQDFPKYSTTVASHNTSSEFLHEHSYNRGLLVPAGMNVMWINGVQINERQIDAFTLLDLLRQERSLISGMVELGFSSPQAISLLSHPALGGVKANDQPQRYDWRDATEGGNVIIWLNDIEKDKRYTGWPVDLAALLQRTFPGQLPSVRRDLFNLVLPVDLSHSGDVEIVVEQLQSFVKRKLPLRLGLVPVTKTTGAMEQAKILYHLLDCYGISAALTYLESILVTKHTLTPSKSGLQHATSGRKLRREKNEKSVEEILGAEEYEERIFMSRKWVSRLAADGAVLPLFVNGAVVPRNENWLQSMSSRVNADIQTMQRAIFEGTLPEGTWPPMVFLSEATGRRNPLIMPEDEKTIKVIDVGRLYNEHVDAFEHLPVLQVDSTAAETDWAQLIVVVDLTTKDGRRLLSTAAEFRRSNPAVEVIVLPTLQSMSQFAQLTSLMKKKDFKAAEDIEELCILFENNGQETVESETDIELSTQYWSALLALLNSIGLEIGENGLLVNGRLVGPIPSASGFGVDDFEQLLAYERVQRINPVYKAMSALGLSAKIVEPLVGAKITSLVAISLTSDIPEGIYEQTSALRLSTFNEWKSEHTAIKVGNSATAAIRITATIDPASEQAQRWIPILKVLSELDGVYMELFLNPKDKLQELPVKRFYRYVLDSEPKFNDDGSLTNPAASFSAVPQEALLTVGMDVPPSWLVAPKDSIYDLDNIKLSNVKGDVDALYELEHVLIEGHSRLMPDGEAPRGAQLVLGTARDVNIADTIIMANLGYFQFKANPGYYRISLQKGRSSEIFNIDSLGLTGFKAVPGDHTTEVALMSFQGTTLYPRLSRKPGKETEDVLEVKADSTKDFVAQGLKYAESILGLGRTKGKNKQAEINIFSVASGHLYERMLNIMMVSVMKHTKSTVKFWFIEQFLSPSFKDFIPHLAAEYGFQYEMVTYKWPHWLRAQKEKQREIWGYKILFLDVLFPLSLDKVIFVDADQIVRTDMIELVKLDLQGAPYGFTPMCDSRTEMEGFRFWKQGYWKNFLKGLPYHISALYVVDLRRFRQIAAGDRLRQQYHQLSADPGSLANLDQDLPNHMQTLLPIHSLPQEWLWCETWCSDESLKEAKTIDLCNNPLTKEPKLDRARRQVPEWTVYDDEIAAVSKRLKANGNGKAKENEELRNSKSRTLEAIPTSRKVDEL